MSAEPTRERVAAYEKALGCWTLTPTEFRRRICFRHQKDEWTDLGCPQAVAAARVEAERVAEVEVGALRGPRWVDHGHLLVDESIPRPLPIDSLRQPPPDVAGATS